MQAGGFSTTRCVRLDTISFSFWFTYILYVVGKYAPGTTNLDADGHRSADKDEEGTQRTSHRARTPLAPRLHPCVSPKQRSAPYTHSRHVPVPMCTQPETAENATQTRQRKELEVNEKSATQKRPKATGSEPHEAKRNDRTGGKEGKGREGGEGTRLHPIHVVHWSTATSWVLCHPRVARARHLPPAEFRAGGRLRPGGASVVLWEGMIRRRGPARTKQERA
ncbi:hypothetical protein B0H17DRAFT_1144858 [Mycena rosella]|uniref:Uncharacterized protein n=1 Tax=Mycena rosella TaxID=1033263 RepID=A0AAD7G582_MYCRO|nr:hypothetical protein B0H17DRAFT_1144858 [Mycena rosella]